MQRDVTPDVLRGFALLGILVVNIQFMGLDSEQGARGDWLAGSLNGTTGFLVAALFTGKFYLLFSFLYGYSSSYIVKNQRENRGRWVKRCFALMLFGIFHFTFLWHGDIIFTYGLLGLLLLAFFFRSDKTLKIWTRVIFILSIVLISVAGISLLIGERFFPQDTSPEIMESQLNRVLLAGSFVESIAPRLELWTIGSVSGLFLQGGMAFAAFLLGVRLARINFLTGPLDWVQNSKMIRRGLLFGIPIQFLFGFVLVRNEQSIEPSEALYLCCLFVAFVTAPLLSMAYIGVVRAVLEHRAELLTWMKPAGRMSLTVYISQSVFTSFIFGPWGLGLFQDLQMWQIVVVAIVVWLVLVYLCTIWLKKYKQGPLESVLSLMTQSRKSII